LDFHESFLDGPAYDGMTERAFQKFGDDRQDVDAHVSPLRFYKNSVFSGIWVYL
jgi:hypothetical protein